jgi:hypothetical protein
LGLWQFPQAVIGIIALLVVAGLWVYFRAARSVGQAAGHSLARADIAALLILIGGLGVLALDAPDVIG